MCKRFRIDNSKREKHTALIDCELLAKVYINLIDQKEPIFQFQKEIIKKENKNKEEIVYSKKIIKPSKQELENHKEFMKREFKRNFFN